MMNCDAFSGFLILSDLDGTFWNKEALSENIKAVERFTSLGGRFSFATGRTADFLRDKEFFTIINAPACLFNGGVVYDFKTEQLLYERHLKFTVREFLEAIGYWKKLAVRMFVHADASGEDNKTENLDAYDDNILNCRPIRTYCVFNSPEQALEFKDYCSRHPLLSTGYASRSWTHGVELNALNGTKGDALDFIKAGLKDVHTAIGIGDFDNDLKLIEHADIGVAVGNAVDEVKRSADWIVKPYNEGSLKDLIDKLELEIEGRK